MGRPDFSATAPAIAWYARQTPQATALVEFGVAHSYQALAADLARCVQGLATLGVGPGMLVGIGVRHERTTHLLLQLACEIIGAATVSLTREDLTGGDPLAGQCEILLLANVGMAGAPAAARVIPADWPRHLPAASADALSRLDHPPPPDGIVGIVRTSGTTGAPKAITLSQGRQQRMVIMHLARMTGDILPHPTSLCLYGLAVRAVNLRVLGVLQHGGTVLFAQEDHAPALLAGGIVNHAMFAVGDIARLVHRCAPPPAGHVLHVELFGAGTSRDLRRLIGQRLTDRLSTRYSANETGLIADTDADDVGTLADGVTIRIVDETGADRPLGEPGMIQARTTTMVESYLGDPALTAAAFVDGWYRTNDIGYQPAPGKLVVLGRADDVLNIGGVKVPPGALEDALRRIPGVRDAVVMSIDRPDHTTTLLVAIEMAGEHAQAGLRDSVSAILSRHVRHFEIMPLPWFPRTETGKVRRQDIKAAFLRRLPHPETGKPPKA